MRFRSSASGQFVGVEPLEPRLLLSAANPDLTYMFDIASQAQGATSQIQESIWTDLDGDGVLDTEGSKLANCPVFDPSLRIVEKNDEGLAVPATASLSLEDTFLLHSNPSALMTIYLDFDGHVTSGTSWNSNLNGGLDIITPAYSFEGGSSFSDAELTRIQSMWERVAEDYLPFDVDVTTEDPGSDALTNSGGNDTEWGVRVAIGGSSYDWYGHGAGGVAYVGSFTWDTDTPTFVFSELLGGGDEKSTAEASSHEVGHTLGLYHDGTSDDGYYDGHGSGPTGWAPIMGVGYYRQLVQWSRGEYADANNSEDDLAIITAGNGFSYRGDDHGDTRATASPLDVSGTAVSGEGIIGQNSDLDYYSFTIGDGLVVLNITPFHVSPNLDILASLYDESGGLIDTSNPTGELAASFSLELTSGVYYISVEGTGEGNPASGYSDYGSLGYYSIEGTIDSNLLGEIHGSKWHDLNGNGVQDPGEPGLADWTIFLDQNNNGIHEPETVTTVSSTDVPKSISDLTMTSSDLTATGLPGLVTDVNITLDITHSWDADLEVFLKSPAGTRVELFTDVGSNGNDFDNTTFDDEASVSISSGTAPFTGSFQPEGMLSDFDGEDPNGIWTVDVYDDADMDTGTLNAWSITFVRVGEPSALTDVNGEYVIGALSAGTYTVAEVLQDGWQQTFPISQTHLVTLASGDVLEDIDFGNQQSALPDLYDEGDAYSYFNPDTVDSPGTAGYGQPWDAYFYIGNGVGTASGAFYVDFYLSPDSTISTSDYFLGRVTMSSIAAGAYGNADLHLTSFPGGLPVGDYYVGIIIDPTNVVTESNELNNTGVDTDDYPLTVRPASVNPPPTIGALTDSPDPVIQGSTLTLTANGVTDDHGVASVSFYRDANSNGIGEPGELLGTDTNGADGWSWTGTVTWAPGTHTYLAQATDDGVPAPLMYSTWVSTTGIVDDDDEAVAYRVVLTNMGGVELATDGSGNYIVSPGQDFLAEVWVGDLRDVGSAGGVFAAYLDLVYDVDEMDYVPGTLVVDSFFANAQSGTIDESGQRVDEVGGFDGFTAPGAYPAQLLFTVQGQVHSDAPDSTVVTIGADPADVLPAHDTLLFGLNDFVPVSEISFGSAVLNINIDWHNYDSPLDANDDGLIVPLDALIIINKLNTEGSHELSAPGDAYPAPGAGMYWDVNDDGWVSPVDALLIINHLNNPIIPPLPLPQTVNVNSTAVVARSRTGPSDAELWAIHARQQAKRKILSSTRFGTKSTLKTTLTAEDEGLDSWWDQLFAVPDIDVLGNISALDIGFRLSA